MKTGPKLNLIKKMGEGGGGGVNPTTLITVSSLVSEFDKEAKSDKKNGEWGGGYTETKTTNEVNTKMQLSTQCRA